ncbi:hypothetical protein CRG98_017880 [Punica granatum]|uniref:DUF7745 domain-containing protein n=1 Tax=Punica granatum TaxID=22663 RepID=A0A2I0JZH2_PUNGR|nr:hypothetical protein CRG98_017880 [Punica granatum]
MDRPAPSLRLEAITPPRQDIMRIRRTLRPVDHAFIQGIIGDVVMLTETPVDWIFLRTAAEFWDPEHAVFNFQATELAPTIEEYTTLIQRPTPTTHGIFVPNPFTAAQGQLSTLLHIPAQDFHEELHQSHLGSTLIIPGRVIRQLGGLQDVPAEADRLPFRIQWADSTSTAPARFLQIREIRRQRDASIIQRLYFPKHPIDDERVFAATSAYVARFYARGLASPRPSHAAPTPRAASTLAPEAESSIQAAMHTELWAIREERDRLRCELVDSRAEVADYRELQTQLTRARARVAHLDQEMARTLPAYSGALPTHLPPPASSGAPLPPASLTSAATDDQARITALEGTVNQMAANMTELLALLRGPNPASSSSTPPPGQGPTTEPTPRIPPTQAPEDSEAPPPPTLHASMAHPVTGPYPPPPAPTAVPLPPATFLSSEHILSAPPPVPWTYEGGVGSLEEQFGVMGITHSGRLYENPAVADKGKAPAIGIKAAPEASPTPPKEVTEEEAEAFIKVIKASDYKVVEQMAKSPAHISLLALLLNSGPHREALMRVLTAAQVPKGTPPDRIEETINTIFSNTISFSDDELPSEGCAHFRALHIVCKCNNHIVGRVMIDNGSTRIQIFDALIRTHPKNVSESPDPYTSGKGSTETV